MVVPVLKVDLYETGVATVTNYTTAGAASARVYIADCTKFTTMIIPGSSQAVDYKVQVNNLVDPAILEASPGWVDYIAESTVAAAATGEALSYDNPGFRWVRLIQQLDTSTDNITWSMGTLRDKAGY